MFIVVYVFRGLISDVKAFKTMAAAEVYWRENCKDWNPMNDHAGIYDEDGVCYKELSDFLSELGFDLP